MLFDKTQMLADGLAHDGTVTEVDLGNSGQGKGEPLEIYFQGHGLTAAGAVTVDLQTSDTAGSGHATDALYTFANAAAANIGQSFYLQADGLSKPERYLTLVLTGTSGGTFTAGVVLRGGHHNP